MRHSIKKFTKEEVKSILSNNILRCTEEETRAIFDIFDFQLKEFIISETDVDFEIHFKRTYLMRIRANKNKLECTNEYITFQNGSEGESCHGLVIPTPSTLAEVLIFFINSFAPNILRSAGYCVNYDAGASPYISLEEAQEYMKLVQEVCETIIKKGNKHE
jgi:hypothetical protein